MTRFNAKRSGYYRENMKGKLAAYQSFVPWPLPPEPPLEIDHALLARLRSAHRSLGKLEQWAPALPCAHSFISMYVRKEAVISSQIEGTQATLEDVLDPEVDENSNLDLAEVINYIAALYHALFRIQADFPLCKRLLREIHEVLMQGSRGQEKNPGEFRRSQNWIGSSNSNLSTASYIPPNPEDMELALDALEAYMNADDGQDPLVQVALIHYQFETIHPFLDGNGRIGRLLVVLFLIKKGLLSSPLLYVSYYLKKHRYEYYNRLAKVRELGDYEQWVDFFLLAIAVAADDACQKIGEISQLRREDLAKIEQIGRARKTALKLYDYLFDKPIIEIPLTAKELGLSYNTVASAVLRLEDLGILQEVTSQKRNRKYLYEAYLKLLREGTEI